MKLKYLPIPIEYAGEATIRGIEFLLRVPQIDIVSSPLPAMDFISQVKLREFYLFLQRILRKRIRDSGVPVNEFKLVIIEDVRITEDPISRNMDITCRVELRKIDE